MAEQVEQPQNWHFTWGHGQTLPDGTDAYNCYTIINGTFVAARGEMFARFGQAWSFDYSEASGVEVAREYNMRFVEAARFPRRFEEDGQTPLPAPSATQRPDVVPAGATFGTDDDGDRWNVLPDGLAYMDSDAVELAAIRADDAIGEWGPFRWFDGNGNEIPPPNEAPSGRCGESVPQAGYDTDDIPPNAGSAS